ncbi:DNA fragmentation factor subunit alpha [Salminus brasiliensis]|uniref:DNA fragmentation factor subunit alpha n=1 Tax=Salminus brasiliensis TaxID=930266 RepID=UPI003B82E381
MTAKPCKVCNCSRLKCFGLAVSSLDQLKTKGRETLGFTPDSSVSVVLEDDGTIVEDEIYFLCLPSNTKFMLLGANEVWTPAKRFDGGTAWLRSETLDMETDAVDGGRDAWCVLADQLRQDLASIILMSEADLQSLVDVPCADLAPVLGFSEKKSQELQDTLQRVLDLREEERQSKELLQLYLKVVEKEEGQVLQQIGENALDEVDGKEVESAAGFCSRVLLVLKGRTSPETRLSNEELQMVLQEEVEVLMEALGWNRERTVVLVQACEGELNKRLQQIQALQSLSARSQPKKEGTQAKRRK